MKIAYLSTFYPFRGGIAQFNASLYNELKKKYEISAFTFTTQYPNFLFPGKSQFVEKDDKSTVINSKRTLSTINPFTYFSTAKLIKNYHPNLIITKFWMPFFAPSLGTVYKLLPKSIKKLAILDNVIPHERRIFDYSLIKYFLSNVEYFVCMSNIVQNDLVKLKPDAKFIKLNHPLYNHFGNKQNKSEARKKLNLPNDKKLLLFFGFIRKYKGLDLLIEALNYLNNDIELIICGEVYGSFDEYERLIQRYNLQQRIHLFNRYISDEEVSLFFSSADVCVLPYRSATQSGIISITYHFDLPLIATDVGGLKESIEPFNTGLIVEELSPNQIANKINEFFNSNIDFTKNISKYKSIASWENFASKIIEFVSLY
jgi:glycosyltransferase involved in cell wall biosynthesis